MLSIRGTWTLAALTAASVSLGTLAHRVPPPTGWRAAPADSLRAAEILQQLRSFRMMATVLHVGAHPDDENTQLIASLSRGRAVRTAYLSITRGDGGQNLLGPELGYKLGVARTQELLAARRIDGGRQFFTRALDFGFSKDYLETFGVWDKPEVLGDVVRVIRTFRPDVIITRFSTVPGGTHGHHTGSAVLANEAFRLAGDSTAYPEQLRMGLKVWQPKRIFVNGGASGGAMSAAAPVIRMEVGGNDPVTGETFGSMASRSRAMHKTQGFGQPGGFGGGRGGAQGNSRMESFTLLGGPPATSDIFDGIDTTWNRVPGGADVDRRIADVIARFDRHDPSKSVGALLDIRKIVWTLRDDTVIDDKRALLDRIIAACAGVAVRTTVPSAEVVPGETLKLHTTITVASGLPLTLAATQVATASSGWSHDAKPATRASGYAADWTLDLPVSEPLTQPYWLRQESTAGMFRVDDAPLIGMAENPPPVRIAYTFVVDGQKFQVPDEPVEVTSDTSPLRRYRRLDIIPPASIGFATDVRVFPLGGSRDVNVTVTANRAVPNATLSLDAPAGWLVRPATRSVSLSRPGEHGEYTFTVTAPPTSTTSNIGASVTIAGKAWSNERMAIDYPHIPIQPLQPPARFKAVAVDIATRGKTIAYVTGAGDDVPQALEQMGYTVKQLPAKEVSEATLRGMDAVVIGVRASNTNADLGAAMPALTAFAENGGTVIEQYNQNGGLKNTVLGPYPLTIGGERVTNENAAVTVLTPEHPVLNVPNKITAADFAGWVQERGIYFPNSWDPRYTPIFAMNDAGEAPLNGSLLVAKVGKGYFAYTGLVFFRELPAGVPGAYRLFANLVSLGKPPAIVP